MAVVSRRGRAPARRGSGRVAGLAVGLALALALAGCAHWNTFYNARKAFRAAEQERERALREGKDEAQAVATQKKGYELAISKAQKILDEYPGHGLTDDALFLMAKSYFRLGAYRMSLGKIELLFVNFPTTPFEEEMLFIQALDYLYVGDIANSTTALERLQARYPQSRFRAEAQRVRAENHFTLREWPQARQAFEAYLAAHSEAEGIDVAGLKLGETLLELGDNEAAAQRLRAVLEITRGRETAFRARRALATALIRSGQFDAADHELSSLKLEAEIYKAQGEIALVEVDGLLAQGRDAQAAPILEGLPKEWRTTAVNARAADLLAGIYFRQWRLEDAATQWRDAMRNPTLLPAPERSRALLNHVRDYLAAEQRSKTCEPAQLPTQKLNQANALLLGLGRTRQALALYLEVADLAADDSASAARALYGAAVVYRDSLAAPDSASALFERLQRDFPDSPQAFVARTGGAGDLLTFLRGQRRPTSSPDAGTPEPDWEPTPADTLPASSPAAPAGGPTAADGVEGLVPPEQAPAAPDSVDAMDAGGEG